MGGYRRPPTAHPSSQSRSKGLGSSPNSILYASGMRGSKRQSNSGEYEEVRL